MYPRKDENIKNLVGRAIFWKKESKIDDNFIVGVLEAGHPLLPNYQELGMNIKECRTIASLKNYICRWEMEFNNIRKKAKKSFLQKIRRTGNLFEYNYFDSLLSQSKVVWSLDNLDPLTLKALRDPNYDYVLKDGTVYVYEYKSRREYQLNEYFVMDLVDNRENFVIAECEKCLVKSSCTRSYKKNTLCPRAYNEIKKYVDKLLNSKSISTRALLIEFDNSKWSILWSKG